ncbi:hypothetical protein Pint_26112 [Pistacia integerrima]|uniref:Uncharacterized protein n=1 Tax=Pistacia integerrima TaxID=434235 RepID=A0ACC0YD73_9ROSI|nr:hypothetical protein Pint_26112 [Pistacia integerrima]
MVELESDSSSVFQSCTDLIGNRFSYLHNYNTNFENLRAQVEKLNLVKQRVQLKIQVAERSGEEIENEITEWLSGVYDLLSKARRIIEGEWEGKERCFGGACPDLRIRHQLSRKAAREVKAMVLYLSKDDINNNEVIDKIAIVCIRSLTLKSLPILRSSCLKVTWSDKVVLEDELDSNIPLFGERDLEKLTRFYLENYIEFPSLKQLEIEQCPQFKAFLLTNISTDLEDIPPFFNEKVALPSLEELVISGMDNLKMMWNYQLSEHSFQKLKLMKIKNL